MLQVRAPPGPTWNGSRALWNATACSSGDPGSTPGLPRIRAEDSHPERGHRPVMYWRTQPILRHGGVGSGMETGVRVPGRSRFDE